MKTIRELCRRISVGAAILFLFSCQGMLDNCRATPPSTVSITPETFADVMNAAQDTPGVTLLLGPGEYSGGKWHFQNVTVEGGGLSIITAPWSFNGSDGLTLSGLTFRATLGMFSDADAPMGQATVKDCRFEGSPTVKIGLTVESTGGPPMRRLDMLRCTFEGHDRTSLLLGLAYAKIVESLFIDGGNGPLGHSIYAVHGCGPVDTHGCGFIGAAGENAVNKRGGGKSIDDTFVWCGASIAGKGPGGVDGALIVHPGVYPSGAGAHAIEWLGEGGPLGVGRCIIANQSGSATGIALDGSYASVRLQGNDIIGGVVTEGRGIWLMGGFRPSLFECGFNRVSVPGGNVWIVSSIHDWRGGGDTLDGACAELPGGRVPLSTFNQAIGGRSIIAAIAPLDLSPAAWLASLGATCKDGLQVRAEFIRRVEAGELPAYRAWALERAGR